MQKLRKLGILVCSCYLFFGGVSPKVVLAEDDGTNTDSETTEEVSSPTEEPIKEEENNLEEQQEEYFEKNISTQESDESGNNPVVQESNEVASIGEVKYTSLQEAIDNVKYGETVTLVANTTEDIQIGTVNFTLDLCGKTLTNTNNGKATITLLDGATVKVQNGTVNGGTSYYNIYGAEKTDLTLENVNANAGNNDSSMLDSYGTVHIISGNYIGGLNTIKMDPGSNLTIDDGYFEMNNKSSSSTAVIFNYGTAVIKGGKFVMSAQYKWPVQYVLYSLKYNNQKSSTTIYGGTFENTNKLASNVFALNYQTDSDMLNVYGGSYSSKRILQYVVRDGNYYFKDGNMYVVRKPKLTVYVNGTVVDSYEYNANSDVEFDVNKYSQYIQDNETIIGAYVSTKSTEKSVLNEEGKYLLKAEESLYIKTIEKPDSSIIKEVKIGDITTELDKDITVIKESDITKNLSPKLTTKIANSEIATNVLENVKAEEVENAVKTDVNNILKVSTNDEILNQLKVVSQIYYDVKVKEQVTEGTKRILMFDITPMMQLYLMNKYTSSEKITASNAIALNSPIALTDINVGDGLKMTVPVGVLFNGIDEINDIYIKHEHNGKTYSYPGKYDAKKKTVTFVNKHGFSKFTVTIDKRSGKIEYSELNKTVEITPANLSDELEKMQDTSSKKFVGWEYNDNTYTSITDELLDLVSENGIIKLTPVYKEVSNSTSSTTSTIVSSSGYDDGSPFTTDKCGNVYDRWGNVIYEANGCNVGGYNLVSTDAK